MEITSKSLFKIAGVISLFASILAPRFAFACATCGLNASFTPRMLFISTGFVLLPTAFVGFIGWKLWQENKQIKTERNAKLPESASKT